MNRDFLTNLLISSALLIFATGSRAAPPEVGSAATEAQFRDLYKELVETNTTLSSGSCTLAAERMAARLKAAGFADGDLHPFADPGHPKEGGLVAVYPGRDTKLKSILLLAHIDVVEAKREDWTRDPFKLVEENGSFYARGVIQLLWHALESLPQKEDAESRGNVRQGDGWRLPHGVHRR